MRLFLAAFAVTLQKQAGRSNKQNNAAKLHSSV
jgi:hypothetical protein